MKLYFFLVLVAFSSALKAQNPFHLEISAGRTYHNYVAFDNKESLDVFKNWKTGTSIGAGYAYDISKTIELVARMSYHFFPFTGSNPGISNDDWYGYKVTKKNSHVYESSAGVRCGAVSELGPFIVIQTGLYFFDIGQIAVASWDIRALDDTSVTVKDGTGRFDLKMFAAIGFGFNVPISSRIKFRIEAKLSQTFPGNRDLNPVTVSVLFRL